jgi:hypothetical protein
MEAKDPALTVSLTKLPTGILLQLDKSHVNVALLQSTRLQALAPHDVQLPRAACRCTRRMDEATAWVLDRAHLHLARVCETTLSAIPTALGFAVTPLCTSPCSTGCTPWHGLERFLLWARISTPSVRWLVTPWSRMILSWSRRMFSTTHSHALCECGESSTATTICLSVCVEP